MPWASSRRKQTKSKVLQQGLCCCHVPSTLFFQGERHLTRFECTGNHCAHYLFITNRASIGRWVDNSSKGLQASVGKYKAGVQRLSKADLRKITSTKKR